MALSGPWVCNSWKREILMGVHVHKASGGDAFKAALYDNSASINAGTTAYTTSGELAALLGYSTGGNPITVSSDPQLTGDVAWFDYDDTQWGSFLSGTNFTAYGALVYNSSKSNKAVMVLDFGGAKSAVGGYFKIVWPAADASHAIMRLT